MSKTSVLVLDGHTNQALAVVRSLGRAGHRVIVASPWPRCLASWSRHCTECVSDAGESLDAYASLRELARARGVEVVMPLTERSCLLCNLARDEWTAAGIVVGCAPAEMLMRAFDKAETLRHAAMTDVRIPRTVTPSSRSEAHAAAEAIGYPCVIKPRFSNAWTGDTFLPDRGCAYAATPDDLDHALESRRQGELWPLVQAYVPGRGAGVFALCDRGRVLAWFAHERLRDVRPSGSGSSVRRSVPLSPRLRAPAERLLASMAWHGPAMVEFRDERGEPPCLMEVNGRFWNSLQLAIEAGVDFPRLWLSVLRGEQVTPPEAYAEGVTVRWLWGDVKRLLYVFAGPPQGCPAAYPTVWQGVREVFGPQTPASRLEVWQRGDPWPAVGEWVQGARELWHARSVQRSVPRSVQR
jgi:predicted ATP-grasp superfamily ATP-dependent carboligase